MKLAATKARLAGRLLGCQVAGTVLAILIAGQLSRFWDDSSRPPGPPMFGSMLADFAVVVIVALVGFGVPAFCIALLILHNAAASILAHLKLFCFALPAALLVIGLVAFPPWHYEGILWINLIPLAALCGGTLFWLWQRKLPMMLAED